MINVRAKQVSKGPRAKELHLRGLGHSRNLIVVRAGANSLHERWLGHTGSAEAARGFDLLVAAYDAAVEALGLPGTDYLWIPGSKIEGYAEVFRRHPELLESYDYIALFDDDLLASRAAIEHLFDLGRQYRLRLFQPALSWDSHFSYAATLAMHGYRLRFTNTVEMMCPVFSSEHLRRALPLFDLGYETGIDLVWTRIDEEPRFRHAIIDEVVFNHTRPIGTTKVAQGFDADESYDLKAQALLAQLNASFRGFVCYAAIDRDGNAVRSRVAIALRSMSTWRAWRYTPIGRGLFARLATDFTRHCLWRPLNMGPIDLNSISNHRNSQADIECPAE